MQQNSQSNMNLSLETSSIVLPPGYQRNVLRASQSLWAISHFGF